MNTLRHLVSRKKRRFVWQEFDLDLAYITPRIIAMGFPAMGPESLYRNTAKDIKRFLERRHGDNYKVYNLCSESSHQYSPSLFDDRLACYPFPDHSAPPFEIIENFCVDAAAWLAANPENIIAVHCKAGKGRTGLMICAYLLHCQDWQTAPEAIAFYGASRTHNNKGLTIPSQKRYVYYYQQYLAQSRHLPKRSLVIDSVRVMGFPKNVDKLKIFIEFGSQGTINMDKNQTKKMIQSAPGQTITDNSGTIDLKSRSWLPGRWKSNTITKTNLYREVLRKKIRKEADVDDEVQHEYQETKSLRTKATFKNLGFKALTNDICIRIQKPGRGQSITLCYVWLNMSFYSPGQTVTFSRAEIDKLAKSKNKDFSPKTTITVHFAE